MDDLQKCWVVPCIGQYISLFRSAFNLPEMDIEELEEGLVADGISNGSKFLQSVFISILRGFFPSRNVSFSNWEEYLCRIIERYWVKRERKKNPLDKVTCFSQLELSIKVEILYYLCLYRLDCDDVAKAMKSMDAEALRVQSLGRDDEGNVYWYFYGMRLYREEASSPVKKIKSRESCKIKNAPPTRGRGRPKKIVPVESDNDSSDDFEDPVGNKNCLTLDSKTRWSVVCTTLDEWKVFAKKFKTSKSKCEIALYELIVKNFIPVLTEMYEKKEETQKKLVSCSNRASSRIVNKKNTKKIVRVSAEKPEKNRKRKRSASSDELLEKKTRELEEKNFMEMISHQEIPVKEVPPAVSVRNDDFIDRNLSYEPELVVKLRQVLSSVKLHKDAWPFLYPVDEVGAPCYYDIVKEPIVLLDIERKIELKVYNNLGQIEQDFQKLVSNCRLYNGENNAYTSMAKTLWRVFRKGIAQMIGKLDEHDVKTTVEETSETVKPAASSEATSSSTSKQKSNKKKKSKRNQGISGLDELAEASQQALKDVGKTEGELFGIDTPEIPLKSKTFPDLNVVTIQNHPPSFVAKCKRSSTSSRSSVDSDSSARDTSSPASTSSHDSDNSTRRKPSKRRRFPRRVKAAVDINAREDEAEEMNQNVSIEKPISPDSCNNLIGRNLSPIDNMSNERFSNNESSQGSLKSLRDFGENCQILDISGEATKGDLMCNNLSSILSRIMKDNVFQISDSQPLLYTDNSDSAMSGGSLGPPTLEISAECNTYVKNSSDAKSSNEEEDDDDDDRSLLPPPQLDNINRDFLGLPPIENITTIDASAIGISTSSSSANGVANARQANDDSEDVQPITCEDISESSIPMITPALLPYSTNCSPKSDVQTLPSISTAFNLKSRPASSNSCDINNGTIEPPILSQTLSPSVSYIEESTSIPLPNPETVSTSIQNSPATPPVNVSSPTSYPDFLRFNNGHSLTASASQVSLPVPTTLQSLPNQPLHLVPNLPISNYAPLPPSATYVPSTSHSVLGSSLSHNISTSVNADYQMNVNHAVMTTAMNNDWKLPIKQINLSSKNRGPKKDGSPRQIKKKRSLIVSQNQRNTNGTNVTKTICASESVSEQFIPAESLALSKLSNFVSNTHTKFIDTPKESNFLITAPTIENNPKLGGSSVFIPYSCSSNENGKLPIPQHPGFWNGKDNKMHNSVPTTHGMPYSLFPLPVSTCLDSVSTFPNNGNICMTYSNCRPQPLVSCASSTQPLLYDPYMSTSSNAKTSPPISIPAVGNIFSQVQPLHTLSPNSLQQLSDSRTLSAASNAKTSPPITIPGVGNIFAPVQPLHTLSPNSLQQLSDSRTLSAASNAKTSPPITIPGVGNIFAPVQPLHTLSPNSLQQLPDSRTLSPESQKDIQALSTQKLGDGFFHTYGIQGAHNLPTQQMIPQSYVSIPSSSYVLPVQSSMPSMIPPSLLPNFILNSKSSEGNSSSFSDVRPQFPINRTMPVYTILPNMPSKIL